MSDTPQPHTEGGLLADLVPLTLGYALPETLGRAVQDRLADYPGGFAKARAFALADDISPAFAPLAPPVVTRKEGAK